MVDAPCVIALIDLILQGCYILGVEKIWVGLSEAAMSMAN